MSLAEEVVQQAPEGCHLHLLAQRDSQWARGVGGNLSGRFSHRILQVRSSYINKIVNILVQMPAGLCYLRKIENCNFCLKKCIHLPEYYIVFIHYFNCRTLLYIIISSKFIAIYIISTVEYFYL